MIGFLRFFGILNAAVWFGAAMFFMFGAGTAPFSQEMKNLLGPKNYPYFSGAIAQILIARYFQLQLACGFVALVHVLAEWLYFGKSPKKLWLGLLAGMVVASLLNSFWFQPTLKELHAVKYAATTSAERREAATQSFRTWHGVSQGMNLLVVAGLAVYLWRVANPPDPTRFLNTANFR